MRKILLVALIASHCAWAIADANLASAKQPVAYWLSSSKDELDKYSKNEEKVAILGSKPATLTSKKSLRTLQQRPALKLQLSPRVDNAYLNKNQ